MFVVRVLVKLMLVCRAVKCDLNILYDRNHGNNSLCILMSEICKELANGLTSEGISDPRGNLCVFLERVNAKLRTLLERIIVISEFQLLFTFWSIGRKYLY